MSDFNVESFNYEYAHKCYLAYYTNSGTPDMIAKGKEVAESDKWKNYITKWQSEDSTIYVDDVDENGKSTGMSQAARKEINSLEENGSEKSKKGGMASAVVGASEGAGLVAASALAMTGTLAGAIVYAAASAVFMAQTIIFQQRAKQNRELQARYISSAEKDLQYNYGAAQGKADAIHEMVVEQNALQTQIQEQSNENVGLANAVADATAVSSANTNLAALGTGDEVAGGAYDELASVNDEMLTTIGEYDQIMAEVNTSKSIVSSIRNEMPQFQKQSKNDKTSMWIYAATAAAAIAPAAIGIALASSKILAFGAGAWIMGLLVAGIVLCGVAAGFAFVEAGKQKQSLANADKTAEDSAKVYDDAKNAASDIRSKISESNNMYQNGQAMMEDFAEEDANHNGGPV